MQLPDLSRFLLQLHWTSAGHVYRHHRRDYRQGDAHWRHLDSGDRHGGDLRRDQRQPKRIDQERLVKLGMSPVAKNSCGACACHPADVLDRCAGLAIR